MEQSHQVLFLEYPTFSWETHFPELEGVNNTAVSIGEGKFFEGKPT